jgi:hypothetical protein
MGHFMFTLESSGLPLEHLNILIRLKSGRNHIIYDRYRSQRA